MAPLVVTFALIGVASVVLGLTEWRDEAGNGLDCSLTRALDSERTYVRALEEARGLVDFRVAALPSASAGLTFVEATVYCVGTDRYVGLAYQWADGDIPGILITESRDKFSAQAEPSSPIVVQGVTGTVIRENSGLLDVYWQKDGISFSAIAFPDEDFTEEDFVELLNMIE